MTYEELKEWENGLITFENHLNEKELRLTNWEKALKGFEESLNEKKSRLDELDKTLTSEARSLRDWATEIQERERDVAAQKEELEQQKKGNAIDQLFDAINNKRVVPKYVIASLEEG